MRIILKKLIILITFCLFAVVGRPQPNNDTVSIKIIRAGTPEEFIKAVASNTKIILKRGTYNLVPKISRKEWQEKFVRFQNSNFEEDLTENVRCAYSPITNGIVIRNVNNLTIIGERPGNTRIAEANTQNAVITFMDCSNIVIKNIEFSHDPDKARPPCNGNVINIYSSSDITINNAVLTGSGVIGLLLQNVSGLQFINSTIRECTYAAFSSRDSEKISIRNCSFIKNNLTGSYFEFLETAEASISNSTIRDNRAVLSGSGCCLSWIFEIRDSGLSVENTKILNNHAAGLLKDKNNKPAMKNVALTGNNLKLSFCE